MSTVSISVLREEDGGGVFESFFWVLQRGYIFGCTQVRYPDWRLFVFLNLPRFGILLGMLSSRLFVGSEISWHGRDGQAGNGLVSTAEVG
jgi:hypothetical protein